MGDINVYFEEEEELECLRIIKIVHYGPLILSFPSVSEVNGKCFATERTSADGCTQHIPSHFPLSLSVLHSPPEALPPSSPPSRLPPLLPDPCFPLVTLDAFIHDP